MYKLFTIIIAYISNTKHTCDNKRIIHNGIYCYFGANIYLSNRRTIKLGSRNRFDKFI